MRVALVHDWLTGMRGGERVLEELARMQPEADLYTLVHVPGSTSQAIDNLNIAASPLSRFPGVANHYRLLLPFFPWAIQKFHLAHYDLIVSVSHAVAKAVPHDPAIPHLCYCLTPMRYVWDQSHHYLGQGLKRRLSNPLVHYLRNFDRRTSSPDQVGRFVAISHAVSDRIQKHYGRDSNVVWPPVAVDRIRPNDHDPEDFYLLVGGFVPYKCESIAIDAFQQLNRPLWIVGDGPSRQRLAAGTPKHIRFLGRVSDTQLAELYARCRALIYPQEEDFGIVAVEAQAAGRPVIAFDGGGARDTVVSLTTQAGSTNPAPTGIRFAPQTAEALVAAVRRFEQSEKDFSVDRIRNWSERFGAPRFRLEIQAQIRTLIDSEFAKDTERATSPTSPPRYGEQ